MRSERSVKTPVDLNTGGLGFNTVRLQTFDLFLELVICTDKIATVADQALQRCFYTLQLGETLHTLLSSFLLEYDD